VELRFGFVLDSFWIRFWIRFGFARLLISLCPQSAFAKTKIGCQCGYGPGPRTRLRVWPSARLVTALFLWVRWFLVRLCLRVCVCVCVCMPAHFP
jgi:hypothetical protein